MRFNSHFDLVGKHAFLSASTYHWINYSDDKLDERFRNSVMAQRGTELHDFACQAIRLGIKMPRTKATLNEYVNDALGFRMTPEQTLYYSPNVFGTADAISFKNNLLRVHDLKTGTIAGSPHQLEIYVALFCLEYGYRPGEIQYETRIYQNDEVAIFKPEVDQIAHIMDKIITFDRRIDNIRMEALG